MYKAYCVYTIACMLYGIVRERDYDDNTRKRRQTPPKLYVSIIFMSNLL